MRFDEYWKVLWEIKSDCPVEQYYDKMLRPLFEEAAGSMENVKVVPTFDTRIRNAPKKNQYQCIIGEDGSLIWPDYIFVPLKYTHESPVIPYAAVELKPPNIVELKPPNIVELKPPNIVELKPPNIVESKPPNIEERGDGPVWIYRPLEMLTRKNKMHVQIASELSRYPVIFTDGITWLFLSSQNDLDKIEGLGDRKNICLINKTRKYKNNAGDYRYYAELSPDVEKSFNELKERICSFLKANIK